MKHTKIAAALICATLVVGCTEQDGSPGRGIQNGGALNKSNVGLAAGAVTGGVLGSAIGSGTGQVLAVIGGTLLGGYLGNEIGASLDSADQAAYHRASQRAMETGTTRSWKNSNTGNYGSITPKARYKDDGRYCREYTQTIYIDGTKHQGRGTACREPDGTWRVID